MAIHNPKINWDSKLMDFSRCDKKKKTKIQIHENSCHIIRTTEPMPDWESIYPKVFDETVYNKLLKSRPGADCIIKFKKDPGHLHSKIYPLSPKERLALHQWITEDVKSGWLVACESDYMSPVFFQDKGDKLWPIVDYKQLNSYCIKDIYPLPRINETIS